VDWDTIRQIDAPFVPHLRSITDTSYFPTDDIEQAPAEAPVADPNGAQKDLAFLGYEVCSPRRLITHTLSDILSNDSLFRLMLFDVGLLVKWTQIYTSLVHMCAFVLYTSCQVLPFLY